MLESPVFCRRQAQRERAHAAETPLDMVRDRCSRAADNWDRLAERGEALKRRKARQKA
jgi:hypothetical protein